MLRFSWVFFLFSFSKILFRAKQAQKNPMTGRVGFMSTMLQCAWRNASSKFRRNVVGAVAGSTVLTFGAAFVCEKRRAAAWEALAKQPEMVWLSSEPFLAEWGDALDKLDEMDRLSGRSEAHGSLRRMYLEARFALKAPFLLATCRFEDWKKPCEWLQLLPGVPCSESLTSATSETSQTSQTSEDRWKSFAKLQKSWTPSWWWCAAVFPAPWVLSYKLGVATAVRTSADVKGCASLNLFRAATTDAVLRRAVEEWRKNPRLLLSDVVTLKVVEASPDHWKNLQGQFDELRLLFENSGMAEAAAWFTAENMAHLREDFHRCTKVPSVRK